MCLFYEYEWKLCIVFYNKKHQREHCANQANTNKALLTGISVQSGSTSNTLNVFKLLIKQN